MGVSVTLDEADKKMRGAQWDPLAVKNKDPNFHYRWIRKDKLNMARKVDYLGYEVCKSGEEQSVLAHNTPIKKAANVDGTIEVGDLVLAKIPKEVHKQYRDVNDERIKARTKGVVQSYKNAVNSAAGERVAYEEHRDAGDMADGKEER
jgi:hypothetical protein